MPARTAQAAAPAPRGRRFRHRRRALAHCPMRFAEIVKMLAVSALFATFS
ncbi:hypothetical protein LG3211_1954 [Lysobacter gummosus]|nr:hypothetical protein LG3211_1954 [Lysobacter gummosus]